jgi:hypothetical protein
MGQRLCSFYKIIKYSDVSHKNPALLNSPEKLDLATWEAEVGRIAL